MTPPPPVAFTTVPRSHKVGYVAMLSPWIALKFACGLAFLAVHAALGFGGGHVGGFGIGIAVRSKAKIRRMLNNIPQLKPVNSGWYRPDVDLVYPEQS